MKNKSKNNILIIYHLSTVKFISRTTEFLNPFFVPGRRTTLWAAKMDKITEKADWRAVRGPVLCNWCEPAPLIPSKMVYCGLSRSFFTASHAVVLKNNSF
ncbi:MAG: hypothetical protein D3910_02020 [Candidatus Electrothrix sp. ATG2]|nr:hypothetical protein [Candidatus Electrothrix sp. ATG2]